MKLRRMEDRSGTVLYVFTDDEGASFVSDLDGLEANVDEFMRVGGEIARTIINMAIEGYTVHYLSGEKKVVGEVSFTEEE
ncbi:MAG: hypothetical protein OXI52_06585 [Caldilineaceae bacterium]|nr:hypothetical protein [Caldilineaceae bacterium]